MKCLTVAGLSGCVAYSGWALFGNENNVKATIESPTAAKLRQNLFKYIFYNNTKFLTNLQKNSKIF